jgi:SAM-dependent methyltransferase
MQNWGTSRSARIKDTIRALNLPKKGRALDFGCGVGFFMPILQDVLPGWDIVGVETSDAALQNAQKTYTRFTFLSPEELGEQTFDFIFSHHVLEHVMNIKETVKSIDMLLNPTAWQLHICPCGNKGSFEYAVVQQKKNGIETTRGNRFFYEDPTHERRLTTLDMEHLFGVYGFSIVSESYKNKYWGAISWISNTSPSFIVSFARHVPLLCTGLLALYVLQRPVRLWKGVMQKKEKSIAHIFFLVLAAPFALLLSPVAYSIDTLAKNEGRCIDKDVDVRRGGSEMCIAFHRNGA